jgi:hypothetical protein
MRFRLVVHPACAATPFAAVEADARREGDQLQFTYRVTGAAHLLAPAPTVPVRRDGLWKSTCFEAFVRPGTDLDYFEFNFAPSGEWAAYRFHAYRQGMTAVATAAPQIGWSRSGRSALLSARIETRNLRLSPSARLGLSAVLETRAHEKSYWALAHGADKPDFHRADGFIARPPSPLGSPP